MKGAGRYPVLYLVHGAGDSDDSWTSVGHANYILDNLIAAGRAKPMLVVMPFGHTPDRPGADLLSNDDFGNDLLKDLIPFIEANWRTQSGANSCAMVGLSMGGAHTLATASRIRAVRLRRRVQMGFSTRRWWRRTRRPRGGAQARREGVRLVYYAVGKEDFLYRSIAPTRALLAKYGIKDVYVESGGGHTWTNWRRYLGDLAPRLFSNCRGSGGPGVRRSENDNGLGKLLPPEAVRCW